MGKPKQCVSFIPVGCTFFLALFDRRHFSPLISQSDRLMAIFFFLNKFSKLIFVTVGLDSMPKKKKKFKSPHTKMPMPKFSLFATNTKTSIGRKFNEYNSVHLYAMVWFTLSHATHVIHTRTSLPIERHTTVQFGCRSDTKHAATSATVKKSVACLACCFT